MSKVEEVAYPTICKSGRYSTLVAILRWMNRLTDADKRELAELLWDAKLDESLAGVVRDWIADHGGRRTWQKHCRPWVAMVEVRK